MIVYMLGIGDRHNDNVMISDKGYFHIDFGHILGHYKTKLGIKRESHSFLFTKAYYSVLGGEQHPFYKEFMKNAMGCYDVLRENCVLLYALLELMRDSGIDDIADDYDTQFFLDSCNLQCEKYNLCQLIGDIKEAKTEIEMELKRAVNARLPVINDFFHALRHA